jgi:hypothetical protein
MAAAHDPKGGAIARKLQASWLVLPGLPATAEGAIIAARARDMVYVSRVLLRDSVATLPVVPDTRKIFADLIDGWFATVLDDWSARDGMQLNQCRVLCDARNNPPAQQAIVASFWFQIQAGDTIYQLPCMTGTDAAIDAYLKTL